MPIIQIPSTFFPFIMHAKHMRRSGRPEAGEGVAGMILMKALSMEVGTDGEGSMQKADPTAGRIFLYIPDPIDLPRVKRSFFNAYEVFCFYTEF